MPRLRQLRGGYAKAVTCRSRFRHLPIRYAPALDEYRPEDHRQRLGDDDKQTEYHVETCPPDGLNPHPGREVLP